MVFQKSNRILWVSQSFLSVSCVSQSRLSHQALLESQFFATSSATQGLLVKTMRCFRARVVITSSAEEPLGIYSYRTSSRNVRIRPPDLVNQGDGFEHFWNWFGKNKVPTCSSALEINFRPKISQGMQYSKQISLQGSQGAPLFLLLFC